MILLSITAASAALFAQAPQTQRITAWTNGYWFDGESFRRIDVFSVGRRLALRRPPRIDRTLDLAGAYVTSAFGEVHNHNLQGADAAVWLRPYLSQGIFYVMIQTKMQQAREQLTGKINGADSIDVAFANGAFTAPGGHPSALVERLIANGGMTAEDRNGGFLLPVATTSDIDRQWRTRVRTQRPDFIKMVLVYSEDRAARIPRPADDRHGLDPELAPYLVRLAHSEKLRVSAHVRAHTISM